MDKSAEDYRKLVNTLEEELAKARKRRDVAEEKARVAVVATAGVVGGVGIVLAAVAYGIGVIDGGLTMISRTHNVVVALGGPGGKS